MAPVGQRALNPSCAVASAIANQDDLTIRDQLEIHGKSASSPDAKPFCISAGRTLDGGVSQNMSPAERVRRSGLWSLMTCPEKTGLIKRSSGARARIPPPRKVSQIVMLATRFGMARVLQHTNRAVTPLQREVRIDFQVASSFLPSLLTLATTILANIDATGVSASGLPTIGF